MSVLGEIRIADRAAMMVAQDSNGDVSYGFSDGQTEHPSAEELLVVVRAILPCLTAEQLLAVGGEVLRLLVGVVDVDASLWTNVWLRLMKPTAPAFVPPPVESASSISEDDWLRR